MTFHRGRCENSPCSYDPLSATVEIVNGHDLEPGITRQVIQKPFIDVRFSSNQKLKIERLADELHYSGPHFVHEKYDPLDETCRYGFDLVKVNADIYLTLTS